MICMFLKLNFTGGNIMKSQNNQYAWTAKIGTKGQIVIPKEARKLFNYKSGDTILLLGDITRGLALVKPEEFNKIYEQIIRSNNGHNN